MTGLKRSAPATPAAAAGTRVQPAPTLSAARTMLLAPRTVLLAPRTVLVASRTVIIAPWPRLVAATWAPWFRRAGRGLGAPAGAMPRTAPVALAMGMSWAAALGTTFAAMRLGV